MDKKTTLLIGATGRLGSAIGKALVNHSVNVGVFLREAEDCNRLQFKPSIIHYGHLLEQDKIALALTDVQHVLYFPSISVPGLSPQNPTHELEQTLPALNNLLEAMSHHPGKHLIFPSSGGAIYGNTESLATENSLCAPGSSYALGKVLEEELIKFYARLNKISYTILRFTNIYGSTLPPKKTQGIIERALNDAHHGNITSIWGSLQVKRDYLYIDDVVASVLTVMNHIDRAHNEIFNVGSGEAFDLQTILDLIKNITSGIHRYQVDGTLFAGPLNSQVDIHKFCERFKDWHPKVDLATGIQTTWDTIRKR